MEDNSVRDIDIDDIIGIATEAGKEIMTIYRRDFTVEFKSDNSPLTEADMASHAIIARELCRLNQEIPILSEEGRSIPYEVRSQWNYLWLIDPLDGTKEFV